MGNEISSHVLIPHLSCSPYYLPEDPKVSTGLPALSPVFRFARISYPPLYLPRLLPSRSLLFIQPPLLHVSMPVELRFLGCERKIDTQQALSARALISSEHHLPKYLCCIRGRCSERNEGRRSPWLGYTGSGRVSSHYEAGFQSPARLSR